MSSPASEGVGDAQPAHELLAGGASWDEPSVGRVAERFVDHRETAAPLDPFTCVDSIGHATDLGAATVVVELSDQPPEDERQIPGSAGERIG
ncbi:hypothetical protein [Streptomyces sp. NPDC001286]